MPLDSKGSGAYQKEATALRPTGGQMRRPLLGEREVKEVALVCIQSLTF
jgi:hypothetical protein